MSAKPFGDALREAREAAGLNLPDLAAALQISPRLMHEWEKGVEGKSVPSLLERVGICALLGIHGYGGPPQDRDAGAVSSVLLTTRKALLDALTEVEKLRVS